LHEVNKYKTEKGTEPVFIVRKGAPQLRQNSKTTLVSQIAITLNCCALFSVPKNRCVLIRFIVGNDEKHQ
jgi:hypothetical protein